MKAVRHILCAAALALTLWGCGRATAVSEVDIVPEPMFMVQKEGYYVLSRTLSVAVNGVGQNSPTVKYIMKSLRHAHMRPSLVALSEASDIVLKLNDTVNPELGEEGYLLEVRPTGVCLSANSERGLFYAYQSLMQMLPADMVDRTYRSVLLPECTILDRPRYEWRGLSLNLANNVVGAKQLRKVMDAMATYKMNRLCIDGGRWSADSLQWHTDSLSYFTLSDISSLAEYGADLGIALLWDSLPSLALDAAEGLRRVRMGDEVVVQPDGVWDLDRYQANPRYQPEATEGVSTLGTFYRHSLLPSGVSSALPARVRGGQARLRTECIADQRQAEYMLLPRLLAVAECLWSPDDKRDWQRFRKKVEGQKERLQIKGYAYCEGSFTPLFRATKVDAHTMNIAIETEVPNTYIFYTTDTTTPTRQSPIYIGPVNLRRGTHIKILPVYKDVERDSVYEFVIK